MYWKEVSSALSKDTWDPHLQQHQHDTQATEASSAATRVGKENVLNTHTCTRQILFCQEKQDNTILSDHTDEPGGITPQNNPHMTLLQDKLPEMSSLVTAEVEGRRGYTGTDLRDLSGTQPSDYS